MLKVYETADSRINQVSNALGYQEFNLSHTKSIAKYIDIAYLGDDLPNIIQKLYSKAKNNCDFRGTLRLHPNGYKLMQISIKNRNKAKANDYQENTVLINNDGQIMFEMVHKKLPSKLTEVYQTSFWFQGESGSIYTSYKDKSNDKVIKEEYIPMQVQGQYGLITKYPFLSNWNHNMVPIAINYQGKTPQLSFIGKEAHKNIYHYPKDPKYYLTQVSKDMIKSYVQIAEYDYKSNLNLVLEKFLNINQPLVATQRRIAYK